MGPRSNDKVVVLAADTVVVLTPDTKRVYIYVTGTSVRPYNNWFNMTAE